tara:strand:+ start:14246 stop:15202 length:957 start_codon:yes stop_codon:yes gene_type:complete
MQIPKLPSNEQARMDALRALKVLDTPAEERFDRITRLAQRMFDVPITLITLVDSNRQWFKSMQGIDVKETSRDISFCGHTIHSEEVFYIHDALADDRFADNPLVQGSPNIRFYAGIPLKAAEGVKLGTLCLIDKKPRKLNQEERQLLADLGTMVEQELVAVELLTTDELTHLSNRRGFAMLAEPVLAQCKRHLIPVTIVTFDLAGLTVINDNAGYSEGNYALCTFARLLKHQLRESDVVAHLGGGKFVALLSGAERQQAEAVIAQFQNAVSNYNGKHKRGYDINFCVGIAGLGADSSVDALFQRADAALLASKPDRVA